MKKDKWRIKSAEGEVFEFLPIFEVTDRPGEEAKDIECKVIQIKIKDQTYSFNFINLFQFIYFVSSEEFRKGLQLRYERRINNIPYEVSFKISEEEKRNGFVKRRINLPIDELSMAIARNEAHKLWPMVKQKILNGFKPSELFKGRVNK